MAWAEFGMGRRRADDPRDRLYRARSILDAIPARAMKSLYYHYVLRGTRIDQGSAPYAAEFAWRNWLMASPVMRLPGDAVGVLYRDAQTIDEWQGPHEGTSLRAVAKVLIQRGYIEEFRCVDSAEEAADWILNRHGGIVIGGNWYSSMFDPKNFCPIDQIQMLMTIEASARVVGQHDWYINGYSTNTGLFQMVNSWGDRWGKNGLCFISGENVQRLLEEDGEAYVALDPRNPYRDRWVRAGAVED